ncbi:hypothetical protein Q5752_002128 [Cryptotrichosporon argae]
MSEQTPTWKVAGVVIFYMAVALLMVIANKWVLSSSDLPLTFLFLQLAIAVVCLQLCHFVPGIPFTTPRWTKRSIFAMSPVCAVNAVGLIFNLYCLKLVDASFFQVARGLTLPMTIALESLNDGVRPTMQTILACGFVTWGFTYSFLPSPFQNPAQYTLPPASEAEAPILGMVLGVLGAAMIAVHTVLIKSALKQVNGDTLELAYWTNALSAIVIAPLLVVSGELFAVVPMLAGEGGDRHAFIIGSTVTGFAGFLLCIGGLLSIKITSPTAHMFTSAARSVLLTILGVYLFGDVLTSSRVVSIALILIGTAYYARHRAMLRLPPRPEADTAARKPLLPSDEEKAEA